MAQSRTTQHAVHHTPRRLPDIPRLFLARMESLLGDEYAAFLASFEAPPSVGMRVNTLKIAPEAFRRLAPFDLTPVPWCAAGFTLAGDSEPGKHPYHAAGLYYIQDPSAMAVAELLDPRPGERVLDLAAAPGGKATHIAALMRGQGLLVVNEIHPKRAWELAGNLERWGATNVVITNETPEQLADRWEGFFDRVLLDAPCSGEGMMRKSEAARVEWAPELVHGCALRQSAILAHAARLVRPGGWLAYSTCTFNSDENEGTVVRFLDAHPEFELVEPVRRPGFSPGRPDWVGRCRDVACNASTTVRLWPHLAPGEGHFVALLRKQGKHPETPAAGLWRPTRLRRPIEAAYHDFCAAHLTRAPADERLALIGSYLYALPPDLPDLTSLRFLHPGWWLGTIKGERFEPGHALALGLRPEDTRLSVSLPPDSKDLAAYLRGETFRDTGEDGWALICVDGFPIGWGKRVGGIVKSHYPRGLRRM